MQEEVVMIGLPLSSSSSSSVSSVSSVSVVCIVLHLLLATAGASSAASPFSSPRRRWLDLDVAVQEEDGAAAAANGDVDDAVGVGVVCPSNLQAILDQCSIDGIILNIDDDMQQNHPPPPSSSNSNYYDDYYDCTSDPYLSSLLPPGKYHNITANYLTHAPHITTPHYLTRARQFTNCTGGIIHFADSSDLASDAVTDLGSFTSIGSELYDAYLMQYSTTTEASFLELLETLNDRIRTTNTALQYEDIFPKVRTMGEYRKMGKTRIELLMSDADFFVPIVRLDLLERDKKALPHTWEDMVELVQYYNGTDLNEDGEVSEDYGLCLYPRSGGGSGGGGVEERSGVFNRNRRMMTGSTTTTEEAFIPELMYSTWATVDQTQGIQQGFFFDDIYFTPRIGGGFTYAMNVWKEVWDYSTDAGCGDLVSAFMEGRCAIGYAPPGCWRNIFIDGDDGDDDGEGEGGIAWRNTSDGSILRDASTGEALWRPRMADGKYAEPYRLKPFGSLSVINRKTDELEECAPNTCPRGERIPHPTKLPNNDRARILVESPHVDQIINRVPFYWSGGYGNGIRKSANSVVKDMMWDFFVFVNAPTTSVDDAIVPSSLDEWRYSQLASYEQTYEDGGWSFDAWNEHQKVMLWAMGNDVNSALTLRVPGVLSYTRDVLLPKFLEYMDGTITIEEVKTSVYQGWENVTAARGLLPQLCNYWFSLGVDGLSEAELCRIHRPDMDMMNPTVCVKYDPKDTSSNSTLLIAVLVPVCLLISAGIFLVLYIERKHRSADLIWKIKKNELKYDDPPEIAGRGTFGLVVKAEYRGTIVAVKRVIPPKNFENRGVFSDYDLTQESGSSDESKMKIINIHERNTFQKDMVLDCIPDNEEVGPSSDIADLEAGVLTPYQGPKRRISIDSNVSVLSSTLQTTSGNTSSELTDNSKKWTRFFGQKSIGINYEQLKQDFVVEMRVLSKLRHPCITTVMGSVIEDEPLLVMEYMENGSLYDLLHNETMIMDGEVIFPILQDIARGARFLHAADPKVIHGDLKAANVLVDGRFRAKIADFGLSAKRKCMGASGTPYWMAPELLRKESMNTAESDVYSFGILLYELYSRKDPYEGEHPSVVLDGIVNKRINKRPPVPAGCPARIADIMKECIDGNPEKRPTFEEIDVRIRRLDSENVEPGRISFGHQKTHMARRASKEEDLIQQVFPRHVAQALLQGRKVEPDRVEMATMFFSDIVGFTSISAKISPDQVSDMLDRLYLKFDELSVKHDVFKIETIGDAYVGVCNLVKKQDMDHAKRITEFAIDTIKAAAETPILPDEPDMGTVRIRIGVHCGPLVARVVGSRNPRYCVFGDTVNTCSRMESHSLPMKIHCSDRFVDVVKQQVPGIQLQPRGMTPIKGKGLMDTYFIDHDKYRPRELVSMPTSDEWQHFLSIVAPEEVLISNDKDVAPGSSVSDEWQQFLSVILPESSDRAEREPSQSQLP